MIIIIIGERRLEIYSMSVYEKILCSCILEFIFQPPRKPYYTRIASHHDHSSGTAVGSVVCLCLTLLSHRLLCTCIIICDRVRCRRRRCCVGLGCGCRWRLVRLDALGLLRFGGGRWRWGASLLRRLHRSLVQCRFEAHNYGGHVVATGAIAHRVAGQTGGK